MTKKSTFRLVWVMLAVFWAVGQSQSALAGDYSGGGEGTADKPYRISTAEDMNAIGANTEDWGSHFVMVNDINLAAYKGTEFNIIGTGYYDAFTGVFDGNGYTISSFTYTVTDTHNIGLFGYVRDAFDGADAVVKDLTLINPYVTATGNSSRVGSVVGQLYGTIAGCGIEGGNVTGYSDTGGLIGNNRGRVSNCYATACVAGTWYTGGLVGYAYQGTITNCYASGIVAGTDKTGGLVGDNWHCAISNCYATGGVTGYDNTGGLVGYNSGTISNCYAAGGVTGDAETGGLIGCGGGAINCFWDIETSGQSQSAGGTGKTTAEMKTASTFPMWAVCENQGVWTIDESNDYPRLTWEGKPGQPLPVRQLSYFLTGTGTAEDPYMIHTAEQLNLIWLFPCEQNKHFRLANNIDLSGYTGTEFNIIGSYSDPFTGVFDGNSHTISNFTYETSSGGSYGLFGYVGDANALIKDLHLTSPNVGAGPAMYVGCLVGQLNEGHITGCSVTGGSASLEGNSPMYGSSAGGLVGRNQGMISNCRVTASVTGNCWAGGLVGHNSSGTILNCYTAGSVTDPESGVNGGLVGSSYKGTISKCYSATNVSAGWMGVAGGLVGNNGSGCMISNCYATGSVTGGLYTGGLVGGNSGAISKCYATGSVTGSGTGGLVGVNEDGGIVEASFWDIETSGQTTSAGGIGLPTELMQRTLIFTSAGWDFVGEEENGTDDIWSIHEGIDYPVFVWEIVNFVGWYEVDMADFAFFAGHWMDTDGK